jgi:hypothetical protein
LGRILRAKKGKPGSGEVRYWFLKGFLDRFRGVERSCHDAGSRRQEAQRLGRILRAKKGKPGSGEVRHTR